MDSLEGQTTQLTLQRLQQLPRHRRAPGEVLERAEEQRHLFDHPAAQVLENLVEGRGRHLCLEHLAGAAQNVQQHLAQGTPHIF